LMDLGVLNKDVSKRIESFVNPQEFATDESAAQRAAVFGGAWEMFASNPIVGSGVGASREWEYEISSHNQYLNLMVDHGALGFFILPLIILASIWGAQGEARQVSSSFAAFVVCWGFFSHNVLEEYYILLTFALLASMSLASRLPRGYPVQRSPIFITREAHTGIT
jgi:O-antigen ligase